MTYIQIYKTIFKWMSVEKQLNLRFSQPLNDMFGSLSKMCKAKNQSIIEQNNIITQTRGLYIFYSIFQCGL